MAKKLCKDDQVIKESLSREFKPLHFHSNQCYEVRTALRKYKCNIEYPTKIHVQHPVKSIFPLFGSWRKTLLTLCILVWGDYEVGQLSLKQNLT